MLKNRRAAALAFILLLAPTASLASFFPPYDQPVIASQAVPGIVAGQCIAASSDLIPVLAAVVCGGGGGGSDFPTGITTGIPDMDGPFAIVASAAGPTIFKTDSSAFVPSISPDIFGSALTIQAAPAPSASPVTVFAMDNLGDVSMVFAEFQQGFFALSSSNIMSGPTNIDSGFNFQPNFGNDTTKPQIVFQVIATPAPSPAPSPTAPPGRQELVGPKAGNRVCAGVDDSDFGIATQSGGALAFNQSGAVGICGNLSLSSDLAVTGNIQSAGNYVPTRTLADGTAGDPTHCVISGRLGLVASASSTTVTFTSGAVFRGFYTLTINDNTSFLGGVTRTAQSTTGFTFTSTSGHTYSYQACGE